MFLSIRECARSIMGPGLALILLVPAWMAFRLDLSLQGQLGIQRALRARQQAAGGEYAPGPSPRP